MELFNAFARKLGLVSVKSATPVQGENRMSGNIGGNSVQFTETPKSRHETGKFGKVVEKLSAQLPTFFASIKTVFAKMKLKEEPASTEINEGSKMPQSPSRKG